MQRVLGIDPGDVRVGLAISDELGMLAHPLVNSRGPEEGIGAYIAEIVRQKEVGKIVVGVPRNMDGTFGPRRREVPGFYHPAERSRDLSGTALG